MTDMILSDACRLALEAIQTNPLEPGAAAEAHCRACAPCREARVMLLAQEEEVLPLVPAGYFERLPDQLRDEPLPGLRAAARRVRSAYGPKDSIRDTFEPALTEPLLEATDRLLKVLARHDAQRG